MASERVQRQVDRLLDEAEEAVVGRQWDVARARAESVLALDPDNAYAAQPSSFANGRYQVKELLGEGGRKRVYRAQDTVLDRDVALAVIKTEGLDETSRARITREARAMGRLGDHPHVLQIFDLSEDSGQP